MIDELTGDLRSLITEGIVLAINDTGQVQTVDVQTADGVVMGGVEVHQLAGFAGCPPVAGAKCVLVAVGGDPANLRAIGIASPATRYGGQQPGEYAICAPDGTRVAVRAGGIVEVWGATSLLLHCPVVDVVADDGMTVHGNLTVDGQINATGDIIAGGVSLMNHTHPTPSGESGAPVG